MEARTSEQKAALREAYRLLTDQFHDVLIVCSMEEDNHSLAPDMDVYWWGGYHHANSLAQFASRRLESARRPNRAPK